MDRTTQPPRFETLIERHHDEIYAYLWRLLNSASETDGAIEAEDLTQQVFMRAYQAFARLRPDSNCRAWLYKIATHCAYTALKQGRRRARQTTPLLDEAHCLTEANPSPEGQAVWNETWAEVRQAIAALPPKQQAAVVLRYVQELDYATIAQALICSEESARANVYQALRRLRRILEDEP